MKTPLTIVIPKYDTTELPLNNIVKEMTTHAFSCPRNPAVSCDFFLLVILLFISGIGSNLVSRNGSRLESNSGEKQKGKAFDNKVEKFWKFALRRTGFIFLTS